MPITITQTGYRGEEDQAPRYTEGTTVPLAGETEESNTSIDPKTGDILIYNEDGSVTVRKPTGIGKSSRSNPKFDDNLAEDIAETDLDMIASMLLEGIEDDIESRRDWENTFKTGINLLGLKLEEPSADVVSGSVSKVWHPLLLEAVVKGQSNAMAELLPVSGPVKVRDDEPEDDLPMLPAQPQPVVSPQIPGASPSSTPPEGIAAMGHNGPPVLDREQLADAFEKDFNHYLTVVDKPYYADFDKMLFTLFFGGCTFRKVYIDPLLQRPISRYINPIDLIVSNEAVSLDDAARITHRSRPRRATIKRMQLSGQWRDIELQQPNQVLTDVENKERSISGQAMIAPKLQSDHRYEVYECYTELDLVGFEHKEKGKETGLPLPYRVTIEKDSRKILEIRRNWKENDKNFKSRRRFVKYGVIPGFGLYDYGYIQLLGNTARTLTGIERQLLDAGQFSNFPGFLISKQGQRQETTVIRLSPGTGQEIDTGGLPIGQVCMPLPYKEPSAVLAAISEKVAADGRQLASTAEIPVGEGRADVPVGTIIAMIEQSTKVMAAAHKRQHASQQEEFELLRELFAENPQTLWKFAKSPARKWEQAEEFTDLELVPASDPNVPSHIHRIMQATAVIQVVQQLGPLGNPVEAAKRAFRILGIQDMEALFLAPQPQMGAPPNPAAATAAAKMAELQLKAQQQQQDNAIKQAENQRQAAEAVQQGNLKMQETQMRMADSAADRETKLQIERMQLEEQRLRSMHELNEGTPSLPESTISESTI